jgi:hypothetical protein
VTSSRLTGDGEAATHVLVVEIPIRMVGPTIVDNARVKDALTAVLGIARVAGGVGCPNATLTEIEEAS